jgi:uncharacterized membrane protein
MSGPKRCCQAAVWLAGLLGACGPERAIDVHASGELVTAEDGTAVRLGVSLREPPRGTLTVRASVSDASEASASGPLHFDASNWQTPQEFVVTGRDDAAADGDVKYEVTVEAQGSALALEHRYVQVFSFVNLDDEIARFRGLGDLPGGEAASYANAVSAAGDVVVGWSGAERGDEAFRWTWDAGISGLGGNQSRANDVSPNGQVIVGSVAEASYESGRAAAIWRAAAPIEVVAPYASPGGPILFYPVDGTVALDSGDLFGACIQKGAYGERLICHIAEGNDFAVDSGGDVFAGDDAGHLVGTRYPDPHGSGAIGPRAYESGLLSSQLDYPTAPECVIPHQCAALARAFSTDPVTIVGTARLPPAGQSSFNAPLLNVGFVVTESEGVMRLEDLAGGDEDSGAYAIDASGRVIGGFGANAAGRRATVWVDRSPRLLADAVASAGGHVPDGWILGEVRAISDDGRTFVGNGTNPAGEPEAFIVVLPTAL